MVKRTIQTSKPGFSIGIEHDQLGIRAARLSIDGRGGNAVQQLEEVKGNFSDDDALIEGFRQIREKLSVGPRDSVIACLSGKQVFAAQMEFRQLPREEMEQALRLELRKSVAFEIATATLDFQILSDENTQSGLVQVMVAVAANSALHRETRLLEKAGLKPTTVEVLALVIANALWTWQQGEPGGHPLVAMHLGPQVSTIVIDGNETPFYNRNVYFSAEEALGKSAQIADRENRIKELADEVTRSLAFYEKNAFGTGFKQLVLLGEFLDAPALEDQLSRHTRLPVTIMNLAASFGYSQPTVPGRFDLAVALALRGES